MAPNPDLEPCPHCRSNADVRPSSDYRYKCHLCGRPRIPIDARLGKTGPAAAASLKQAHRSRLARIGWQLSGVGFAGVGALMGVLSLGFLFTEWGLLTKGLMMLFTLVPIVISVLAFSAGKKARQQSRQSLDEAWQIAVSDMFRALGGKLTAHQLSQSLRIDEEYAMQLLTEAEVQQLLAPSEMADPVRIRVAEEGDLSAQDWDEAEQALGNVPTQAMRAREEK